MYRSLSSKDVVFTVDLILYAVTNGAYTIQCKGGEIVQVKSGDRKSAPKMNTCGGDRRSSAIRASKRSKLPNLTKVNAIRIEICLECLKFVIERVWE